MSPQTTWRPFPFGKTAHIEITREDRIINLIKRNGGIASRKEIAQCLGLVDGGHLDPIIKKSGVVEVGLYRAGNGRQTKLYGIASEQRLG